MSKENKIGMIEIDFLPVELVVVVQNESKSKYGGLPFFHDNFECIWTSIFPKPINRINAGADKKIERPN